MRIVSSETRIGDFVFPFIVEGEIESSWEMLTKTAKITMPRKLSFEGKSIAQGDSLFKRGDIITMKGGYDMVLEEIFSGFVSAIKPKMPMEFEGEDEMWKLKQTNINASYANVTLNKLLKDHCPIPFKCPDISLGQFRIKQASLAQTFEELKKTYGLYTFVRNGTLYSGLATWPELTKEGNFAFGDNILDDSDLEYRREEDVKIKVKAVSMLPDNKKIEIEVGDADGEQRSLYYYNLSEKDLKDTATKEIAKLKYTGYYGTITTFGTVVMNHGDIAVITDPFNVGRDGKYFIKKVGISIGYNGYRQKLELFNRAD